MNTLLGHLARFATFYLQGEVLCTQGLAYLLGDPDMSEAFTDLIGELSGSHPGENLLWVAEACQEDSGRPDLEARTRDGSPSVKVEAKLGAVIVPAQLHSYADDLRRNSRGGTLVLLVPERRREQAASVVRETFEVSGEDPWKLRSSPDLTATVVSWKQVFGVLSAAADDRGRVEVEGLRDMYRILSGYDIVPLAGREELKAWRERERDLLLLVDRATRELTTEHPVYPFGTEPPEASTEGPEQRGYYRRYVGRRVEEERMSFFSIGLRDPFRGYVTPVWMRFSGATPAFQTIRDRLRGSDLDVVDSERGAWLPLEIPLNAEVDRMVSSLVEQAEVVMEVVCPSDGSR
jgi:hypothetical protein